MPNRSATADKNEIPRASRRNTELTVANRAHPVFIIARLLRGPRYHSAFVFHEKYDKFRRFGFTCIPPEDVDIIGAFVEGLTRRQSHFLFASDLHHDRAFQHINKRIGVVPMYFVRMPRRIFHRDHHTFFAGTLCQVFGHEWRYLSLLCYQRGGHETYNHLNYFCERHTLILRLTDAMWLRRVYGAALCLYA